MTPLSLLTAPNVNTRHGDARQNKGDRKQLQAMGVS
jgi:hypothetical protein